MANPVAIVGLLLALIAAAIHVYIFVLESLLWRKPATRAVFRVRSMEAAETLRPMAFNQGFYNLFLALGVVIGWLLGVMGDGVWAERGVGMMLLALASMAAAALVLVLSNRALWRAAVVQGVAPALAIVALFLL